MTMMMITTRAPTAAPITLVGMPVFAFLISMPFPLPLPLPYDWALFPLPYDWALLPAPDWMGFSTVYWGTLTPSSAAISCASWAVWLCARFRFSISSGVVAIPG